MFLSVTVKSQCEYSCEAGTHAGNLLDSLSFITFIIIDDYHAVRPIVRALLQ